MPTLKDEVEDTQIFRWKLSEWDKLPEKLLSPEFSCGDYKW
jgi:ubiquitin carboxyl-terminal hydrolase 7